MRLLRPAVPVIFLLCSAVGTTPGQKRPLHKAASQRPNIVVITLDTTRADRMGFLGSQRGLTPSLDTLAHDAIIFPHAYSHVPLTTASHTTIFTGTYPQFNHANDFGVPLSERLPYLPDLLHHNGY